MGDGSSRLTVAYLHYGVQSGVTPQVTRALEARGHRVHPLGVPGPLEWRGEDRKLRPTWRSAAHLMLSGARFGTRAFAHRWNTTYAFDVHTAHAGSLLGSMQPEADVVLQNGALFAPGIPPPKEYVLMLDHTRALTMARRAGSSVLAAPVDYGTGWQERETRLYRGARAIATFSRRVAESLQLDYGVRGERIHVVGGGANVWPDTPVRHDDGETIVFVGKDFRRKGGPVLLKAFEQVRRQRNGHARLVVAGPRERLDLPEGAEQLGPVPMERLIELFSSATVFALPTLHEPYGLAYLDAMACAVPCVGTLVGAVPELIEHGVTGLLVPPGDELALARSLASLLEDKARARAMGVAGREKVEARFRWHHVGERLEAALLGTRADAARATSSAAFTVA